MPTDWHRLGNKAKEAYENHHKEMVDHFVSLARIDADYARYAVTSYCKDPDCLFPKIGDDVKAMLDRLGVVPAPPRPLMPLPADRNGWRRIKHG